MLAALVQQAAVGGMSDGLGHDGGIDDDSTHAGRLHKAAAPSSLDAGHEQGFHAFLTDALPPSCQAGRVDGQFGLQVGLVTDELPVRVLQPGVDHRFIRGIDGVLQVQQPSHQTRRLGGHGRK